jgi:Matrixin
MFNSEVIVIRLFRFHLRLRDILVPNVFLQMLLMWCVFAVPSNCYAQGLQVSRNDQSSLSDAEAMRCLTDASNVLQKKDGPNDVSCRVSLTLAGTVLIDPAPSPADVYTEGDFDQVCLRPGYVHVVNTINYCGGSTQPGIIGCSKAPGKCMIVVRLDSIDAPDEEGILWAHEFGHTKGLAHRQDERAIMNPYIGATEREVNKAECALFLSPAAAVQNIAPANPRPSVVDFVHRTYIEGVPYEIASSYSHQDAEALLAMIGDPKERPHLTNIVTTLGMIGDPVAVTPLRNFIEQGSGTIDSTTLRAKTSAVIALGYIVNRTKDEQALTYLAKGVRTKNWTERHIKWMPLGLANEEQRNLALAKASILGLGLSGSPEAEQVLNSGQIGVAEFEEPELGATIKSAIDHALKLNRQIQRDGLTTYYRGSQKR